MSIDAKLLIGLVFFMTMFQVEKIETPPSFTKKHKNSTRGNFF
jgi:hypothetical protein